MSHAVKTKSEKASLTARRTVSYVVLVLLSFLWPVCGFALIALYDLTVTDKIFAALEQPDPEAQSPDGELAPKGRTPGQQ